MNARTGICVSLLLCFLLFGCSEEREPLPASHGDRQEPSRPSSDRPPQPRRASGTPLFTLPALDGREVTVRGPAALFFFTTWCGYCKQVMPEASRMAGVARSQGWQVYGIDANEPPAQVMGFAQVHRPNFPVLLDQTGQIGARFNVLGYPTFILIDAGGRIVYQGHELPRGF